MYCEMGADGVVIGMLNPDGTLDTERMAELIKVAGDKEKALHRAFDVCVDPMKALEEAIELGFDTILTSGQKETAWEGKEMLKALQEKSAGRIEILAASGIGAESIEKLLPYTGITSYHMSGKIVVDSAMKYRKRRNRTWIVRAWRLCALADFGRRNRESSKGFKNNRLTSTDVSCTASQKQLYS